MASIAVGSNKTFALLIICYFANIADCQLV